jgi:hypothetical protein
VSWFPTAEIFVVNSSGSMMAYARHRAGDVAPDWVIGKQLNPIGVAKDPATGRIYVTNQGLDSISVFAPDAEGPASPVTTIRGSKTGLESPTGIAVDSKGKIYVVNGGTDSYEDAGRINVYAAGSSGNVAPDAVITGHRTRLEDPQAVTVDSSGKIYAIDGGFSYDTESPPRVMVYAAGSKGNVAPIVTISGNRTGLDSPDGIAVDPSGKIYVLNDASPGVHAYAPGAPDGPYVDTVTVYLPGAKGNIAPVATIIGTDTGLGDPKAIALDSGGKIYVTNAFGYDGKTVDSTRAFLHWKSVTVYPADANGDIAPIATIRGAQTGLTDAKGLVVSPDGKICVVTSEEPGVIAIFLANSNGNVKPIATITDAGTDTKLDDPTGVALDSTGQIYVANNSAVNVYPSGTNRNVPPLFTIAGEKTPIPPLSGIALDSQKNIYVLGQSGGTNGSGSIGVFAAGSTGDARPSAIISFTTNRWPTAVTADSDGNIYIASNCCGPGNKGSIAIYPPDSHGIALPVATIFGMNTGIGWPTSVALDSRKRIYVTNPSIERSNNSSVNVYPSLANLAKQPDYPNVRPIATISGVRTKLTNPKAIALDSMGSIYVLNVSANQAGGTMVSGDSVSITVYRSLGDRTGNLDEAPLATIAGPNTKLDMGPMDIAVWGRVYN